MENKVAPSLWADDDVLEDTKGARRERSGSISSVSSDPLDFRGARETAADDSDNDSLASQERVAPRRAFHALEPADVAATGKDVDAVTDPIVTIPLDFVSEAAVAVLDSVIVTSRTVVANMIPGTLVIDIGTKVCLSDGKLIGSVASVLGPVESCSYAILSTAATLSGMRDLLIPESTIHYDVRSQSILFDPVTQCSQGRGTDASFLYDEELPEQMRPDFSDDEEERQWKKRRRQDGREGDLFSSDDDSGRDEGPQNAILPTPGQHPRRRTHRGGRRQPSQH